MIHRCRPDFDLAFARGTLRQEAEEDWLASLAQRPVFRTPAAREGLRWVLESAGIGAGDEVAVPALICAVVGEAIVAAGARPVTFGVSDVDFGPSVVRCEEALSSATRAVVLPHLYGVPADLAGFRELCEPQGRLLIEDCAPCILDRSGEQAVGTAGEAAVFSFQYDKPLSLGWGGAVALSETLRRRVGEPSFPVLTEAEDRLLAAALLVQHALTDRARLGPGFLRMDHAVKHLLGHPGQVEEVLALASGDDAAERLAEWCEERVPPPPVRAKGGLLSGAKGVLKRLVPGAVRRWRRARRRPAAVRAFGGRALRPGGLGERLLAAQLERLAEGAWSARRAKIADLYKASLDREKMVVPMADCSPRHWLRFPVALRGGRQRRDQVVERAAAELGVEIGPYTWPTPLHQVPHLKDQTRVGAGSEETAELMEGLLNLPVHAQVTDQDAHRIVEFLNHA